MRSTGSFAVRARAEDLRGSRGPAAGALNRFLRVALSFALSGVFLWVALRGVSWDETAAALADARLVYLLPIVLATIASLYFRALRWGVLLRPLAAVRERSLVSATAMGFAANMLLPLRAGEVLRPWFLSRAERLPLAQTMATVALERVLDMATLLLFFGVAALTLPLPPEWRRYGWVFFATFLGFLAVLIALRVLPRPAIAALKSFTRPFPERVSTPILHAAEQFAGGLASLGNVSAIALAVGYSFAVWFALALTFGFGLTALDLPVPWLRGALSLTTIVAIAVAIPGGPGFIGMFQVGCEVGLGVYGVSKSVAFSYSVIVHGMQFASTVAVGLYFFLRENVSLKEMRAEVSTADSSEG